jgi:hypothetical protein
MRFASLEAAPKTTREQTAISISQLSASDGNYVRFADEWEQQLSEATRLKVVINQYNSSTPKGEKIRGYCDGFSILLFSRQASRA